MKIDPRSDRIALHYTGSEAGEPAISGVPARDLTENDVARLVDVAHPTARGAAHQAAIDSLADRLTAGPYRRTAPAAAKVPAKKTAAKKPASVPRETPAPASPVAAPEPTVTAEPSADTPKEA